MNIIHDTELIFCGNSAGLDRFNGYSMNAKAVQLVCRLLGNRKA